MLWSRRSFLQSSLLLPAAAMLRGQAPPAPAPAVTKLFPRPDIIHYDADCFTIHGRETFIYGLECPYPRCRPELWRDRFIKVRQAGFNTIDTYIFWNYHERSPGQFDFSELGQYLQLAHEFGFWVIVRPGPYVDAEFDRGGFPAYVIAQRFPVRSMHPESLRTSKHWFDHVLPVIRRQQITNGGPIILMQVENEIDFTTVSEAEQKEYIRYLARLAWDAGIEVPLISNVSSVVRDRTDPDMARILDACDFYPRWSFLVDRELPPPSATMTLEEKVGLSDRAVLASLRKMRRDEPNVPLSVAELGTGYYSKFGGKLSEDEEGTDAWQTDALTKTIIEHGVTYFNYYLGWGGSNFDWAAKGVTTTYDFAAPIRECGGLWEKYYVVRAIGAFMQLFGPVVARSRVAEKSCQASHPDVSVSMRVNGASGFLFVRGNTDAEHHFRLTFRDPVNAQHSFSVPHVGQLVLGPRRMKIMPVQLAFPGGLLRYSTAEFLSYGTSGDRSFVVLYDDPGAAVELALEALEQPRVVGPTSYQHWDHDDRSLVLGLRVSSLPHFVQIGGITVALLPRHLALRTWVGRFTHNQAGNGSASKPLDVPFITDAYLLRNSSYDGETLRAEIDYLPGRHPLTILLPSKPQTCLLDGNPHFVSYDPALHAATLEVVTPELPVNPIDIRQVQLSVERFDPSLGQWQKGPARVLEDMGPVPYGYVKYRAQLTYDNQDTLYFRAYLDNDKKVFLNGKFVTEASKADRFVAVPAAEYLKPGVNSLEISYELFGSTEFGTEEQMAELNGIESVSFGETPPTRSQSTGGALAVTDWEVQTFPAPMRGRQEKPDFVFTGAQEVALPATTTITEFVPAFAWCRARFALPPIDAAWSVPWKAVLAADRDALLYLNGNFVGRFVTAGPQTDFYLPEPFLHGDGKENLLTVVLAYTNTAAHLKVLRIEPYVEYCALTSVVACVLS